MRNRVTKLENVKILVVELLKLCIPIVIGFVVVKTKFLDAGVRDALSRLIARVLFPILMFCIFLNPDISVGQIWDSRYLLLTAVGWVVVSFLIGMAAAKLLKLDRRRGPVFFILLGMSNVTYMGLPLCVALFGERLGQLGVALVSLAGHIAMWTLGVYLMSRYSAEPGKKSFSLKAAFTPVTVAILAAIVLKLVGVRLPDLVYSPLHTLGNVTPQLALVYIGVVIATSDFSVVYKSREVPVFLCLKLLLLPLLFGLVMNLAGRLYLPEDYRQLLMIEYATSAMISLTPFFREYGYDDDFAGQLVFTSIALNIATLPLVMLINSLY